jgi:hypothetical protein
VSGGRVGRGGEDDVLQPTLRGGACKLHVGISATPTATLPPEESTRRMCGSALCVLVHELLQLTDGMEGRIDGRYRWALTEVGVRCERL